MEVFGGQLEIAERGWRVRIEPFAQRRLVALRLVFDEVRIPAKLNTQIGPS
jgi:hypothetical protein